MNNFAYNRYSSSFPVVKNIIIINALMLLATYVLNSSYGFDMTRHFGLFYFRSDYFNPYQFVTYMFMHGGFAHLLFNMYALFIFGRVLETVWGSSRFFSYYMITGLGAAILHTLVNHIQLSSLIGMSLLFAANPTPELFARFIQLYVPKATPQITDFISAWQNDATNPGYVKEAMAFVERITATKINIPTVGASGAVFGVLLAFGMYFPNTQLMLLFPPIPIQAKYFVMIYGAIELYLGLSQPGSQIAHFAHLGGMIFGFILIKYWNRRPPDMY